MKLGDVDLTLALTIYVVSRKNRDEMWRGQLWPPCEKSNAPPAFHLDVTPALEQVNFSGASLC